MRAHSVKAAIYARVSTGTQDRAGTIDTQLDVCRRFCRTRGWTVVAEFQDRAVSGASAFEKRTGLMDAISAGNEGRYRYLVAFDLSRLSRDNLAGVGAVFGAIEQARIVVVEASTGAEHDVAAGGFANAVTLLQALVNRIDLDTRARRTLAGKERIIRAGGKGVGKFPFGLEFDEDQQRFFWGPRSAVVVEVYRRYADGERPSEIAADFNVRAVVRPSGHGLWRNHDVQRLLGMGKAANARMASAYRGRWRRWRGEVDQILPALIDDETWFAVQERRRSRSSRPGPRRTEPRLLDDRAVCGLCGRPIVRASSGANRAGKKRVLVRYYKCWSNKRRELGYRCELRARQMTVVDQEAWATVADALLERWDELAALAVADFERQESDDNREKALSEAKRKVRSTRARYRRARLAYDAGISDDEDDMAAEWARVTAYHAAWKDAEAELASRQAVAVGVPTLHERAVAAVANLRALVEKGGLGADDRLSITRDLLEIFDGQFVVYPDRTELVLGAVQSRAVCTLVPRLEQEIILRLRGVGDGPP